MSRGMADLSRRGGPSQTRSRAAFILGLLVPACTCASFLRGRGGGTALLGIHWSKHAADAGFLGLQLEHHWLVKKIVSHHFPGAMEGSDVAKKVMKTVKPFGLSKDNVIYGQSLCADEINSDPGHVSTILTKFYGRNFPMGGMGGCPHVGKTGFTSFAHHAPKDGHVFVLFGPHIGYSPEGSPGKFLRRGQDAPSACGSAITAFRQLISGNTFPFDDSDIQQAWLRSKLAPWSAKINAATYPMVELAYQNYKIVEREMANIINTDYGSGKLVLLGGIQINMPYPVGGYFMPLHFSIRAANMAPVDLLPSLGVQRPEF